MKPSLPQGTRDFSAETLRKRQFIINTIKTVFELYGFEPLETPAMENLETLMGKYGDEGDKLIFKILNNGLDHSSKTEKARLDFENILAGKNEKSLTERALRYDLTIPFARYVAMNYGKLTVPDSARVAGRQASKGKVPGVFSMRCRCCRHFFIG
jgi:histidyl-tRNA synthetase